MEIWQVVLYTAFFLCCFSLVYYLLGHLLIKRAVEKRMDLIIGRGGNKADLTLSSQNRAEVTTDQSQGSKHRGWLFFRRGARRKQTGKGKENQRAERLRAALHQAGLAIDPAEWRLGQVALTVLLVLVSVIKGSWLGVFLSLAAGIALPELWLKQKTRQRRRRMEQQLTDMLSTLANSLRAGYSLLQSLELLSQEIKEPLGDELKAMIHELHLGISVEDALLRLNQRMNSKDMELIITAVLIQRQIGGNLAQILDTILVTIREREQLAAEVRALTAQGRMTGVIFMLLPPGLAAFIFFTNPDYILTLFRSPFGWAMLAAAVFGQVVGFFVIKRIIRIQV